ncbi:MAG: LamG-like jellyroll fold domain-containing protein [Anaerohalosphaeraceae bacterium]
MKTLITRNRHLFIFVLPMLLTLNSQAAVGTNWIEQWGITWTFDKPISTNGAPGTYRYGTYANGDYWIVGPVTIISITPLSQEINGRTKNGSMINPVPGPNQGYDSAMADWAEKSYSAALNVGLNVGAGATLTVQPNSSLVSTISHDAVRVPQIRTAAVLTVVQTPPPAGAFRPPYCGTNKTSLYTVSNLDYSKLARLTPVPGAPTLATAETWFQKVWLDHKGTWTGRYLHPSDNMPDYGRDLAHQTTAAALILNLNYTNAQKETLLIRYVQLGIDLYGILKAGGSKLWINDGGHMSGRKLPILFAGTVLNNDTEMKAIGAKSGQYLYTAPYGPGNPPADYIHFGEDDQVFYVSQADVNATNSPSWSPDSRDAERIPYSAADIGLPEWGIVHATNPYKSNKYWLTAYRETGCTFVGAALVCRIMNIKDAWNHPAFFDYTDRYMDVIKTGGPYAYLQTESGAGPNAVGTFVVNMWNAYRADYGPIWPATGQPAAYTLTISAANGTVSVSPNKASYTSGETVTLTAVPASGYLFSGWSGDASGSANPLVLTMNGNKTVQAAFTPSAISLAAHWKLAETDGTTAFDSIGSYHGTLRNGPVWTDTEGLSFNNNNEYVEIPDSPVFSMNSPMTLSAWVKLRGYDNDWPKVLIKPHTAYADPWELYAIDLGENGNMVRFLVSDGTAGGRFAIAADGSTTLNLNEWYHIVGTYNGSQIALYLNGRLLASAAVNFPIGTNSMPLCLGGRMGTNTLNGWLSEVRVYSGALSAEQIQELYAEGRPRSAPAVMTGLWLLDDYGTESTADVIGKRQAVLVGRPKWGRSWAEEDYLLFENRNQALQIPSETFTPQAGTISLWLAPSSESGAQYLLGHTFNSGNRIALLTINGKLAVSLGDTPLLRQNIATLENSRMAHVVLTWNEGQYAVYLNGQQRAEGTYSGLSQLRSTFDVGNYGDPALRIVGFLGLIDEVRTYNTALTENEVRRLYQTYLVKENRRLAFQVQAADENGNKVPYRASNLPSGAVFDPKTQTFTWRPWYRQAGEYNIEFNADGLPSETVTVTVQEVQLQNWYQTLLESAGLL